MKCKAIRVSYGAKYLLTPGKLKKTLAFSPFFGTLEGLRAKNKNKLLSIIKEN